jgi:hypothetical protein
MLRSLACLLLMLALPAAAAAQEDGLRLFEEKIRPVLAAHCYKCHSAAAKKQRGGLHLDTAEALRRGGDSGPALVPGKPRDSLLLKAIRHDGGELLMPPEGKLSPEIVADFERWIALGAPDPRKGGTVTKGIDFTAAQRHWAFQPIRRPELPAVKNRAWAANAIDAFVLARLESAGLNPSPRAEPRTLIRRLYFDLIGLPPTAEEVEEYERAVSAKPQAATEEVVDRLLASPHYGERWGRHWLDVARYADTKDGVLQYGDARIRPYAYTYRDYVIRAFNEDVPFDRFVHEQLAADQMAPKDEPWRLAAMGFLTLGRQFDKNIHDVLDDRIDVVTRGLLGLTVTCARCHDHKYDPVPQQDYYSLYGVFANSEAPLELPLLERPEANAAYAAFEKEAQPKRQNLQQFLDKQYALLLEQARVRVGEYLERVATKPVDPLETAIFFLSLAPDDLRPQIVNRWRKYLDQPERADDPVFGPWYELMRRPETEYAAVVATWLQRAAGTAKGEINPLLRDALAKAKLQSRADVAKLYGKLLRDAYEATKTPAWWMSEARRQLAEVLTARDSPCYFTKSQCYYYMSRGDKDNFGNMLGALDVLAVKTKNVPPRAMVLVDAAELHEPRLFVRGNPAQPGERVPRRFLRILSDEARSPFAHGSGRLDLARALTDPSNPLTSRVIVNRVWMHHFGEPLVATPSDFGLRTPPPPQPELLDYLAWSFVHEHSWSLKKLHRAIVLSNTYQQASDDRPECRKVDMENRLLWRAQRRRLDFEAMRDALLAVSGRLDRKPLGRPVDVANDAQNRRRTVYGLVDRQSLPGLFRAFDFAVPDASVERRPQTSVPQQALFGMNNPFVVEQATALAARVQEAKSDEERVRGLYRLVLARPPESEDMQAALHFLHETEQPSSQLSGVQQLAQVLLLTNEAMFID